MGAGRHTLTPGSISSITCTTADRFGRPNGIWVNCADAAGASARTSSFLFVARLVRSDELGVVSDESAIA